MNNKYRYFFIVGMLVFMSFASAASLWTDSSRSVIVKKSKYKVGDTITVIIEESLNAVQSGSTKSSKGSNVDLNLSNRGSAAYVPFGSGKNLKGSNDSRTDLSTQGKSSFTGTGSTSRETSLKTTVTAMVIDVQPNGNIFLLGQRQIKVNNESEQLEISGVINADKIADDDTVYSTQLANAKISIKGAGVVASQQSPGFMTKMFEWLF